MNILTRILITSLAMTSCMHCMEKQSDSDRVNHGVRCVRTEDVADGEEVTEVEETGETEETPAELRRAAYQQMRRMRQMRRIPNCLNIKKLVDSMAKEKSFTK